MTSADAASGTMRTVRFHENGEPGDVLRLESAAVPEPGPGRVRVAVRACGLAPADRAIVDHWLAVPPSRRASTSPRPRPCRSRSSAACG